jgi:hypothetical protein
MGLFSRAAKVGANDPCPCGTGKKFKKCCRGRVDWDELKSKPSIEFVRRLSPRGKNLAFVNSLRGILQLDRLKGPIAAKEFKRAFTPAAIKAIYELIPTLWPDGEDLRRVLRSERAESSGLYTGIYEAELIERGITRHSLYSDRILLVDPFLDVRLVRAKFNPLQHPEMYGSTTIRWARLWLRLEPWIAADIVHLVRTPDEFDGELWKLSMEAEEARSKLPGMREALDRTIDEMPPSVIDELKQRTTLGTPDAVIRARLRAQHREMPDERVEAVMKYIQGRRDDDPYFYAPLLPDGSNSEMHVMSTGTSYELAKITAMETGSHLITDLRSRWKEIEIDRKSEGVHDGNWTSFAKAFHGMKFKFLENVSLDDALRLREEERLESLRGFFTRIWSKAKSPDAFSPENAGNLAAELRDRLSQAEAEWISIDRELINRASGGGIAAAALGAAVQPGVGAFALGGAALGGTIGLIDAHLKRRGYQLRHPEAFLLGL